jgi:hypothetical protein
MTDYVLDGKNFSVYQHVQKNSGAHLPSYPVGMGYLSSGVKWLKFEADQAPPLCAKVKSM